VRRNNVRRSVSTCSVTRPASFRRIIETPTILTLAKPPRKFRSIPRLVSPMFTALGRAPPGQVFAIRRKLAPFPRLLRGRYRLFRFRVKLATVIIRKYPNGAGHSPATAIDNVSRTVLRIVSPVRSGQLAGPVTGVDRVDTAPTPLPVFPKSPTTAVTYPARTG